MDNFKWSKCSSLPLIFTLRITPFNRGCMYFFLTTLLLQLFIFAILLYFLENEDNYFSNSPKHPCYIDFSDDIRTLASIATDVGFNLILLEKLVVYNKPSMSNSFSYKCIDCSQCRPIIKIALDFGSISEQSKRNQLFLRLIEENFLPVVIYNEQPRQKIEELQDIEISFFVQRKNVFQVAILHPREDNTWWIGNLHSDSTLTVKLAALNLTLDNVNFMLFEQAIDRFELSSPATESEPKLLYPKDITSLLNDLGNSKFIECNYTRAASFEKRFGSDKSSEAVRFRHRVWKMLSRVKTVLDSLGVEFWLSSGTALGYYRECNIIAHSKDVDIGVWATSYSDRLISEMHDHMFRLKISLGLPNDSMELSFVDQSGIKLDIFFFYKESDYYWNGGTQVKSGKKFKYKFPKFSLCWTLFKDLRVRIPCETEAYIRANYGPDWFVPVKSWDWKTSPSNVQSNGIWPQKQLSEAIKLFV